MLWRGLLKYMDEDNSLALFPGRGSPPLIDIISNPKSKNTVISPYLYNTAYDNILSDKKIKVVIMSCFPKTFIDKAIDVRNKSNEDHLQVIRDGLERTLDQLRQSGKQVVIVLDPPELPYEPKKCQNIRPFTIVDPDTSICEFDDMKSPSYEARRLYRTIVEDVVKKYDNVTIFSTEEIFLQNEKFISGGAAYYKDTHHLNGLGSELVGEHLWPVIRYLLDGEKIQGDMGSYSITSDKHNKYFHATACVI